jgi:hypothetical protein
MTGVAIDARDPTPIYGAARSKRRSVMKKPFTLAAVAVFSIVALAQLLRLLVGWEITIQDFAVPLWASGFAVVVATGLAVTVWRERLQ